MGAWDSDINSPFLHGFVYSKGEFISFDVPVLGSQITQPNDINAQGHIVGLYLDADYPRILASGSGFHQYRLPRCGDHFGMGINSRGQIVGNHYDAAKSPAHGFVAQPQ